MTRILDVCSFNSSLPRNQTYLGGGSPNALHSNPKFVPSGMYIVSSPSPGWWVITTRSITWSKTDVKIACHLKDRSHL